MSHQVPKYAWPVDNAEKWGKADEIKPIEGSLSDGSDSSSLVKEKQLLTSELRELERERLV